ncbi:putative type III secretion chaperone SycE [Neochlamydia sp. TUME1]|jgi:hypothetical protein|nr:putative type III secretion chaperone SycE [Neochlamydia sp. TUME1]
MNEVLMPSHNLESLLKDLGEKIELSHLEPTGNNNITLLLKGNNEVVLQKHNSQPYLIISFEILELPIGRFRENIFREALKFNHLNKAHEGIFAFSKKTQMFFLFDMLPFDEISGEQVNAIMQNLSEKVTLWKEALNRGEIPTIGFSSLTSPEGAGSFFGIRP